MRRGDIWWAALPRPRGSEPGHRRPVVIVSSDAFNRSRIRTVLACAVTTNLILGDAPGNVRLRAGQGGLDRASIVNVSQVVTLDKAYLVGQVGTLSTSAMARVDAGLALVLDLNGNA